MPSVLSDHNCEGHARSIFQELDRLGYTALLDLHLLVFADIGLGVEADDELVWTTCQTHNYLLGSTGSHVVTCRGRAISSLAEQTVCRPSPARTAQPPRFRLSHLLLTGNRNTSDGEKSLERTMQRLAHDRILPV